MSACTAPATVYPQPQGELFVHLDESALISEGKDNHDWESLDWTLPANPGVLEFGNLGLVVPATIDDAASTCSTDVSDPGVMELVLESDVRAIHHLDALSSCPLHYVTDPTTCTRPEYLFAKAFKRTPDTLSGISLKREGAFVRISKIAPDGLFSGSNLRPGDQIISINGVPCRGAKATKVAQLIKSAKSAVSIMAHNEGGNASLVSSSVQKLDRHEKVGVCFQNKLGALHITKVDSNGLLGDSLIMPGNRCMLINGALTPNASPHDAASIIADADGFVTIVSRPNAASAMVVACENIVWWSRAAVGLGLAAGAVHATSSS